ncbi:MAG: transposase, partial [Pseudomonadota bacterium]
MKRDKTLSSLYSYPGFKASSQLEGTFRDPKARIVVLQRRKKVVRSGSLSPKVIGVDEISKGRGHDYRIVVSDLEQKRVIWVGGKGRQEKDLDMFFDKIGSKKSQKIRLAVMDMWRPFRNSVTKR